MKRFMRKLLLLSGILFFILLESASALPGFSRQTGKSCMACHTQNIEKLSNYGRHFALSGYTIYDTENETQEPIEGSEVALGIPAVLNASAVLKARYIKSTDVRGELQVLEGSGLYFGGRFAENAGGILSLNGDASANHDVVFGGKAVLSYPTLDGYSGISLYSTQVNGLFWGMENYNTGLNAALRQFENSYATNAAQATGVANSAATGLQLYYGDERFFATAGASIPAQNSEGIDAGSSIMEFGRIAYNQPLEDWNFMLGGYGFSGNVKASNLSLDGKLITSNATIVNVYKESYGLDFEMTGNIFNMTTMTTLNIVMKNIVDVVPTGFLTNPDLQTSDNKAKSLEFQINPIVPLGVKIAYLDYTNNDNKTLARGFIKDYDYRVYSAGLNYLLRQNISVGIEYSLNKPKPKVMEGYYDLYLSAIVAF